MDRGGRVGIVLAGYVLAVIVGGVASVMYNARVSALPYDTSGGMYAGGEAMTGLGVFLVVALAPTLLALWFLRRNQRLWQTIAVASLVFAAIGLVAVLMPPASRDAFRNPVVAVLELLRVAHLLGMPLWTVAFVLFAILAPTRPARQCMVAAIGVELVVGVCAAFHWFVPSSPI